MEASGRISEEWSSLSGLYTAEEADFMNQLLGNNCSVPEEILYENSTLGFPCAFWPGHESTVVSVTGINNNTSYFPSNDADANANANFFSFSQGSSSSTDIGVRYRPNDPSINFDSVSMGFSLGDAKIFPYSVQSHDHLSHQINENTHEESGVDPVKRVLGVADKNFQANRECEELVSSEPAEKGKNTNLEKSEKRSRSSWEVQKKRNVKSKKNTKSECISKNEEDRSFQRQSSSSGCSEDDSNASQELNVGSTSSFSPKDSASLKSNGKSMPAKSPAADPQSVYARRRRERINERLRILQNLVPNGTKVDISTMLEEAVQYVKFLQLQIKLLSSDDLWMYAPIAYNGLNIGLDLNITPTKQP